MRFVLCAQSWYSFNGPHCHLLLMMDFDCPLAFRHKKGEYIFEHLQSFCFQGGEHFYWLEFVEFRLYLGASHCIYLFSSCHIFVGLFMLGGDTFIAFYVSCFNCLLIYIYELFIDICLLFCLLVFSTHAVMHFCLVFQEIYKLIQLSCCLHLQLMDSSQDWIYLV